MSGAPAAESGAPRMVVVFCPDWPVTAVLGPGADQVDQRVAVVEGGRVVAASQGARAAGVRRAMKVRSAQGLVDDLEVRERLVEDEARLFDLVAEAVTALAAHLEVLRPGVCAIPAAGAARFHGGEEQLAERLIDAVEAAGFECRVGIADGLAAAQLAARAQRIIPVGESARFLAPFPVTEVVPGRLADLLVRLGLVTAGQFAALPPASIADRFGAEGAAAHRLARGLQARPVVARTASADVAVEERFEQPYTRAEPMVFAALGLAERMHERLGAAGLGCERFEVEVECADGTTASRAWRHEGLLSAGAVAERIRWQLQAWQQRAAFAASSGGVVALRLVPDGLVADPGRQLSLLDGQREAAQQRMERAASRVQAMLGHGGIVTAELAGGRGPGDRVVRTPWGDAHQDRRADGPWPGRLPAPSPARVPHGPQWVRLLDEAGEEVRVTARAEAQTPPVRLVVAGRSLDVVGWAGPWPATERWWSQDESSRLARLQVTTTDGHALLLAVEGGRWRIEGAYDT